MAIRGFDHVAITAVDVEKTLDFYRRALGAELLYEEQWRRGELPVALIRLGGCRLSIHPAAAPASPHARLPTPGSADLCFRWDGPLEDAQLGLARQGVELVEGPVPRPAADGTPGRSVYFRDPDGNLLELLSTR